MKRILVAPDSFKDALPAREVCLAIEKGLKMADKDIEIALFPLADGGEGTVDILIFHSDGEKEALTLHDPLMRRINGYYGLSANKKTAFAEMAQASGLQLLKQEERNPMKTTTYGTGEIILDAIQKGAATIYLGIGSSATNDCGIGMAAALGYKFLDENGNEVEPLGENLIRIERIDSSGVRVDFSKVKVIVLCDVDNPLFGPKGAAFTYARQKGADDEGIKKLDEGLRHFSAVLEKHFKKDFSKIPGSGAAGGMGAGTTAFLNARLQPGIDTLMEITGFEKELKKADYVITGEGRVDAQTLHGKVIIGITKRAAKFDKPVIALCGSLEASPEETEKTGLKAVFPICNRPMTLEEAIEKTAENLTRTAYSLGRLI